MSMSVSVCIEMIYPDLPVEARIEKIAAADFKSIEFWDWRNKTLDDIAASCRELDIAVTTMSGHRAGSLVDPADFGIYRKEVAAAIAAAERVACTRLMLLTNPLEPDGKVANTYPNISMDQKHTQCIEALSRLSRIADEYDVEFLLEPLNTRLDHPGYWLDDADRAFGIIHEVGHPRVRLLYDLYHMGVMGRDLHRDIERNLDAIGYFHAADVPGRHEPGTGAIDFPSILRLLSELGYAGTVGFEFSPLASSDEALATIRRVTETFL
jgi:hydroxypyruvate isomerase